MFHYQEQIMNSKICMKYFCNKYRLIKLKKKKKTIVLHQPLQSRDLASFSLALRMASWM